MSKFNLNPRLSSHAAHNRSSRQGGLIGLAVLLAFSGVWVYAPRVKAMLHNSPKAVLDEAWQVVDRDYVDPNFNQVDWDQVRQQLLAPSYSSPDAAYTALRDALEKLEDPYTRFMNPEEYRAFNSETSGDLVGVGMQLKVDDTTKALTVVKPMEASPALQAGIEAGDQILQINGQSTEGMAIDAAVALIRGEAGTQVRLQVQRAEQAPFEVNLTRQRIEVQTVRSAVRTEGSQKVGYIRLDQFSGHAAEQMEQAIESLKDQQVNAFVLDLRGNPGGRLDQAIDIARMWMNDGGIVRTVDRAGNSEEATNNRTALTDLPMAVLVDGGSASASEILTGSLKDNRRAVIVGTQTFGKALVQESHPLADGSGINVTIAHYFTPSGLDINHRGITPDVIVSLTEDQQKALANQPETIGTSSDPQYLKAIEALNLRP